MEEQTLTAWALQARDVVFRITMPGRVTATNAHRRDGNTLEWKFDPLDEPVEVFAESELGG